MSRMYYSIAELNPVSWDFSCFDYPRPETLPIAGQCLTVKKPFKSISGYSYEVGHSLLLLQRTFEAPYKTLSSLGNWVVQCPFQTSVWAGIEYLLAEGALAFSDPLTLKETDINAIRKYLNQDWDLFYALKVWQGSSHTISADEFLDCSDEFEQGEILELIDQYLLMLTTTREEIAKEISEQDFDVEVYPKGFNRTN